MPILEVSHLKKTYTAQAGGAPVHALTNVSFQVEEGEFVAIMGESGSGKTTLLNILAGLDTPTGGRVLLAGRDLSAVPERELAAFRRDHLGFVFQEFNLLDAFSLRDNILLPLVSQTPAAWTCLRALIASPHSWASPPCWTSIPTRSPAGRSSVPPSRGRSSPIPISSSPTSRRVHSTPAPPRS